MCSIKDLEKLILQAVALSKEDISDWDAIRILGEGWVAEETLAVAVYCALKYPNDFDRAGSAMKALQGSTIGLPTENPDSSTERAA